MSNEKQPLLDPEKGTVPVLITPGSQIHIVAEVQLPPYYEDGPIRYYATKVWELVVLWVCVAVLFGTVHALPFSNNNASFASPILDFIMSFLYTYFIVFPLAIIAAGIISTRTRYHSQLFYQIYHRVLPRKVNDALSKYILAGV